MLPDTYTRWDLWGGPLQAYIPKMGDLQDTMTTISSSLSWAFSKYNDLKFSTWSDLWQCPAALQGAGTFIGQRSSPQSWGVRSNTVRQSTQKAAARQTRPTNQENLPNQIRTASWVWTNSSCHKPMEICTSLLFINRWLFWEFFLFNQFSYLCLVFNDLSHVVIVQNGVLLSKIYAVF